MAQGTRYNPYDNSYDSNYPSYEDRYAEPVDLDRLSSQLRSPHPSRSVATRGEFLPEDSVPLFLAGSDEDPRSPKFARPQKKGSRLLKTGAFAAAAMVATFVAVKNPFAVFANATRVADRLCRLPHGRSTRGRAGSSAAPGGRSGCRQHARHDRRANAGDGHSAVAR